MWVFLYSPCPKNTVISFLFQMILSYNVNYSLLFHQGGCMKDSSSEETSGKDDSNSSE